MAYRPSPTANLLADLPRYVGQELDRVATELELQTERIDILYEALRAAGVTTLFFWDDSIVMADPGQGMMRGNNIQLQSVTEFAISADTVTQASPPFQRLDDNDRVMIRNDSAGVTEIYNLTAFPVFNDTWWLFAVAHDQGAANNPIDGAIMSMIWFPVFEGRLPSSF